MNKILRKIFNYVVNLVFPRDVTEQKIDEVISNIAKLTPQKGDKIIDYPCPVYNFFNYRNPVIRRMIWQLKYRGDTGIARLFANRMYDELCEELAELGEWMNFREPILVPIPVSKSKMRQRGFNQSAAICKALSEIDENRFFTYRPNVLYKIKDTASQAHVKDRRQRLQNLKDSFGIKDIMLVKNKNIILLDDVLTTGSTLTEAAATLKKAGVANVIWIVVAH